VPEPSLRCVVPCIGVYGRGGGRSGVPGARGRRAPRAAAVAWSAMLCREPAAGSAGPFECSNLLLLHDSESEAVLRAFTSVRPVTLRLVLPCLSTFNILSVSVLPLALSGRNEFGIAFSAILSTRWSELNGRATALFSQAATCRGTGSPTKSGELTLTTIRLLRRSKLPFNVSTSQ